MNDDTTRTRPRPADANSGGRRLSWRLHVLAAPDPQDVGRIHTLRPGATVAGRRPQGEATLSFADGTMSRSHVAWVTVPSGDQLQIRDLGSHNGTWAGGQRVEETSVVSGDVVRFGDVVAVVEADDGVALEHSAATDAVRGLSASARRIRAAIALAGQSERPALILGETGTGKESAAGAIHQQSARAGRLVRLNVSAVPANLFEAELFGHARGAFSGANESRMGRIREAQGGTLVLDEIGELPKDLQPKLLRALEESALRPVGGSADLPVDCRFVAATNVDLEQAMASGRLRRDLVARLRHHEVLLPPLRERRQDWMAWADAVAPAQQGQRLTHRLDAEACEALLLWPCPDNLRGLARVLAALDGLAGPIGLAVLPAEVKATGRASPRPQSPSAPDAAAMRALLREHRGNVGAVARALARDRKQVYRWMRALGIDDAELAFFRGQ